MFFRRTIGTKKIIRYYLSCILGRGITFLSSDGQNTLSYIMVRRCGRQSAFGRFVPRRDRTGPRRRQTSGHNRRRCGTAVGRPIARCDRPWLAAAACFDCISVQTSIGLCVRVVCRLSDRWEGGVRRGP